MVKVKLYTKTYCPYCRHALEVMEEYKDLVGEYENIDVTEDDSKLLPVQEKENYHTVPMIYIGDKFIGGASDLDNLVETGEFEAMLKKEDKASAKKSSPKK